MRRSTRAERLLAGLRGFPERLGLETTHRLLDAAGRPDRRFTSVLVAGTNGKGSTATLLAAMLAAAGYRVGLYTSPHLERVEERLRIDGRAIGAAALARELGKVLAVAGEAPTYFEALTVAALAWFARRRVEIAVLEVGMGGRLDATNAVDPVLALVAQIAVDHTAHLGATLASIAGEKAGIMRPGRPVLVSAGRRESLAALDHAAARCGARLERVRPGRAVRVRRVTATGQDLEIETARDSYRIALPLAGRHQVDNLLLALRGAEELAANGWPRLDAAAVARGVAGCRWPGRLEHVSLDADREALIDGAHNAASARALAEHLEASGRRCHLLTGVLADKEVEKMMSALAPHADRIVLTEPASERALPVAELARRLPARGGAVEQAAAPAAALALALAGLPPGGRLAVAGSLYLVGPVRAGLRRRFGRPEPAMAPLFRPASGGAVPSRG